MPSGDAATEFLAVDGRRLVGDLLLPDGSPQRAILIAGATGIRRHLYLQMARELRAHGSACLIFDYRDIGDSRNDEPLAASRTLKQHWGELDMPAALEHLAERVPGTPLMLLGHSAGAQLVGLMPNVGRLARIAQVAGSSGYVGEIGGGTRWLARFLIRVYLPLSSRLLGYAACKAIGWGEDLPAGVGLQWAAWCSSPGYVANSFGKSIVRHYFEEIRCPVLNLRCTDDPIASVANVEDMMRFFPNAAIERREVDPPSVGLRRLGHVDFFRQRNRAAWPLLVDWLCEETSAAAASSA